MLPAWGCGRAAPRVVSPGVPAAKSAPSSAGAHVELDVRAIIGKVSAARQLPIQHEVAIERVDGEGFAEVLSERLSTPAGDAEEGIDPHAAFLLAFDFLPPPAERATVATTREVLESEIAGFYDREEDRIYVPILPLDTPEAELEQRAVLAHEVEHALQAQSFRALRDPASDEEAIARLALLEGDAMVAMGAYLGLERGEPVGRTLRRIADATRQVSVDKLAQERGERPIDRALALTRERLVFPYEEGMLFVADLYRAGGFPLIDAAFADPPTTSAEVLHPERYLAGTRPRPFADPVAPAGFRFMGSDSLGELGVRVLLARCIDRARAVEAAAGWEGDRFSLALDGERSIGLLWASAWQTEDDAREVESALRDAEGCWSDNRLGASVDYRVASEHAVLRSGRVVAFERGLPAKDAQKALKGLLATAAAAAPAPKLRSAASLPPRDALPEPRPGRVEGDLYTNEWLGVVGRIPRGMSTEQGADALDLVIRHPGGMAVGALAVSLRTSTKELDEKTFSEVLDSFRHSLREQGVDLPVDVTSTGPVEIALGRGTESKWHVAHTAVEVRMLQLPICAGTGSVVFVEFYGDARSREVLDSWVDGHRWLHGRNLEACSYLDPK